MYFSSPQGRGFTLIELLVVIAIIGILASIVLVSLGNARTGGAEASIKANLNTIRTQSELYANSSSGPYSPAQVTGSAPATATCGTTGMWADATIIQAIASVSTQAGSAQLNGVASQKVVCKSNSGMWLVAAVLPSNITQAWCVDSLGKAKVIPVTAVDLAAEVTAITTCP